MLLPVAAALKAPAAYKIGLEISNALPNFKCVYVPSKGEATIILAATIAVEPALIAWLYLTLS